MRTKLPLVVGAILISVVGARSEAAPKSTAPKAACVPADVTSPRFVTANGRTTMCLAHNGDQPIETCFAFSPTAAPKVVRTAPKAAKR
ncbi:MAG: hypothetical protein ACKV2T_17790 [Kofleriaceae bacterium]